RWSRRSTQPFNPIPAYPISIRNRRASQCTERLRRLAESSLSSVALNGKVNTALPYAVAGMWLFCLGMAEFLQATGASNGANDARQMGEDLRQRRDGLCRTDGDANA